MFNVVMRRVEDGKELDWKKAIDAKQALQIVAHMNRINEEAARLIGKTVVKFVYFVRNVE